MLFGFLLVMNVATVMASAAGETPKIAVFGDFAVVPHLSWFNNLCEMNLISLKCQKCTSYLYNDGGYGHGQDKYKYKLKKVLTGIVYPNVIGQHRCYFQDGASTSTFVWPNGGYHN